VIVPPCHRLRRASAGDRPAPRNGRRENARSSRTPAHDGPREKSAVAAGSEVAAQRVKSDGSDGKQRALGVAREERWRVAPPVCDQHPRVDLPRFAKEVRAAPRSCGGGVDDVQGADAHRILAGETRPL